jgi:hypothetical protein
MCRFYFDSRYGTTKVLQLGHATTVAGTVATAAALSKFTVMENTVIKDWNMYLTTGGTAAGGPSITIGYSVDGTGTFVPIGTQAFGTHADATIVDGSLTETKINAGDDIVIQSVAGTDASTIVVEAFNVETVEWFVADQVT